MEQIDILRHAVESLERMNVPYLVVGSFASIAYGESRLTKGVVIGICGTLLESCESPRMGWTALRLNAGRASSTIWRSGNKSWRKLMLQIRRPRRQRRENTRVVLRSAKTIPLADRKATPIDRRPARASAALRVSPCIRWHSGPTTAARNHRCRGSRPWRARERWPRRPSETQAPPRSSARPLS